MRKTRSVLVKPLRLSNGRALVGLLGCVATLGYVVSAVADSVEFEFSSRKAAEETQAANPLCRICPCVILSPDVGDGTGGDGTGGDGTGGDGTGGDTVPSSSSSGKGGGGDGGAVDVDIMLYRDTSTSFLSTNPAIAEERLEQIARWLKHLQELIKNSSAIRAAQSRPSEIGDEGPLPPVLTESSLKHRFTPINKWLKKSICQTSPCKRRRQVLVFITDGLSSNRETPHQSDEKNCENITGALESVSDDTYVFFAWAPGRNVASKSWRSALGCVQAGCDKQRRCRIGKLPMDSGSIPAAQQFDQAFKDLIALVASDLPGDAGARATSSVRDAVAKGARSKSVLESQSAPPVDAQAAPAVGGATQFVLQVEYPDRAFNDVVLVGNDGKLACSGVILDRRAVLTAAHCLPATQIRTTQELGEQGKIIAVIESAPHPDSAEDLALLRLSHPADVPIKPRRLRGDTQPPGGILRHVGFGATDAQGRGGFGRKKMLDLPAAGWGCDGDRVWSSGCRPGLEMVVPGSAGRDTCTGDSGGPIYELIGDGTRCEWRLVAVTSRRVADANAPCGSGGIYERVDAVDDWVTQTLERWAPTK